jgi:hypothetical protein
MLFPSRLVAGEPITRIDPSQPKLENRLPTEDDLLTPDQQEKVRKEVDELTAQYEGEPEFFLGSEKPKNWTWEREENGKRAANEIIFGVNGKVRLYRRHWEWKASWASNAYHYDEKGQLRYMSFLGFIDGRLQAQKIYLDKRKNVLEVKYLGPVAGKDGQTQSQEVLLAKPALLSDGSSLEMIWDPIAEMSRDPLDPIASKPGTKMSYPFVGVSVGPYNGLNLKAGYYWEKIGLKAEGMYWNENRYDARGEVAMNVVKEYDGMIASGRMDFLYVFGVGNLTDGDAPGEFYSGFGFENRISGFTFEWDFVNNCFWNFADPHWKWLFNIGWVMKL